MNDLIELKTITNPIGSLLNTICWMAFLSLGIPLISTFIVFISGIGSLFLNNVYTFEQLESNPSFISFTTIFSAVLLLPFLKSSLCASDKTAVISRLALKPVSLYPLIITVLIILVYSAFESYLLTLGSIEISSFISRVEAQTDSMLEIIMLFFVVGLIAPIIEEVIFRGIAFYKLKQSSLGGNGAIIIPSIVFTLMHTQYDQIEVYILIFISSCLFGLIRQLSGSLWYCIVGHMMINFISLTGDFL